MHIEAILTIEPEKAEANKYVKSDEWINKMFYIHMIKYLSIIQIKCWTRESQDKYYDASWGSQLQ